MNDYLYYNLGRAYHLNYQFDKAIENYEKALDYVEGFGYEHDFEQEILRQIEMAQNAKELTKKEVKASVINMGEKVNSEYPDYKPVISADESVLIFTSRKPGSTGNEKDITGRYYEDIYVTRRDEFGNWTDPVNISDKINTDLDEASVGLSPDGNQLFIYKGKKKGGDIYVSKFNGKEWSEPQMLSSNINTKRWETDACLSADGKKIFFASNRKGGYGERDIYVSEKISENEWSEPKNLGPVINTPFDEISPFLRADGKVLYFCSKGHNSMGGFDIFMSEFKDGTWSTPVNIGHPINTTSDDVHFNVIASGRRGYYASARKEGYGEHDIYLVDFEGEEVPVLLVRGIVYTNGKPYAKGVSLKVVDPNNHKSIKTVYQPAEDGKYLMILPPASSYDMIVEAEGFTPQLVSLKMPKLDSFHEIYQQIDLVSIDGKGQEIVVSELYKPAEELNNPSIAENAKKIDTEYEKILAENIESEFEQTHPESLNDPHLEKSVERLLNMTEPVAASLPVNEHGQAKEVYDEVDDVTYVYDKTNPEKGLVEYEVDGKPVKVIPENYQESEALAATEELAETAEEKETSGTSSSSETGTSTTSSERAEEEKTAVFTMMVHFGFDKWTLDEKSKNKVEVIVSTFQRHPNAKIEVVGHTDSKGPESYNMRLSKLRAQAVADYLVSKGVPRNKIVTYGKGESEPIAPNNNPDGSDNPEGRAKNRRTEIKIIE
ncbi:MAG: hypothetical protein D6707_08915 [Bacteroidetes bacterium]|nr:MAG: hypothetical protein D6707_08915 [Bacteroidota bacterium]